MATRIIVELRGERRTLRFETRSAVSSSVNWLIWSTIPATLGLVGAASVDSHRRITCRLCCERRAGVRLDGWVLKRTERAQHLLREGPVTDIVNNGDDNLYTRC